uniref:Uncharacterized protein n=1 Tax=Lutzomyia longipalpis TaxID=7200 RepID=A0A7G3B335_LUTLO
MGPSRSGGAGGQALSPRFVIMFLKNFVLRVVTSVRFGAFVKCSKSIGRVSLRMCGSDAVVDVFPADLASSTEMAEELAIGVAAVALTEAEVLDCECVMLATSELERVRFGHSSGELV